ncbi:MAG TPA: outer membrane beta-barrel protein [Puia sp.]|nr:outer membrane beta-barrel protein [Puia sp.]
MKKLLIISLTLFLSNLTFAQFPMGGGGRPGNGQVPSIGHFYGKVVDSKNNKGIDGASVQLIANKFDTATKKMKLVPIAGMITNKGNFSLENLPLFGNFKLRITAIGYKQYEEKVAFDIKMPKGGVQNQQNGDMQQAQQALAGIDKDLGNIKLDASAETLAEVTVSASKPLVQLGVDRKIYNVEKDISAQGGTGVDVMKNVPSVSVDIDGNVKLRNTTPTIFVDGLPTTLTLDQIPADAIQSVEIITNPGAKYDASGGTSGILNIVLKKNRKAGYNGNVRAGIDQRGRFNLGGDINVKQGKLNVFASGNYGERKSISTGTTERSTFLSQPFNNLSQYDYNVSKGYFAFGRAGLDYLIDNRNTLSLSGVIVHGHFTPYINSDLYVDTLDPSGTKYSYTRRESTTNGIFNNKGGMLSFKHTFPRAGQEFTANANYSYGSNNNTNQVNSIIYPVEGTPYNYSYDQKQSGSGTNEFITAQADYSNPINDKSKFETGVRVAARNIASSSNFFFVDSLGKDHLQPLLSSIYDYHDRIYAGYLTYSNSIKDFGYVLGLRAESSTYNGTTNYTVKDQSGLNDTIGNFSNKYPISLFPSVFISQKLGGQQELQLNYTRRIDRPTFFQLFPFTDYSDSLNLSRGNPDLKPQFTNSFELSYQKSFPKNNTLIASVYYKYTTDLITRVQQTGKNPINDSSVFISTFINANSSFVGGFEIISRNTITKWWDVTSNINIFTSKINSNDSSVEAVGQTYSWFGKINNTFKLTKKLTLQITGDYTSKTVLPPGGSAGNTSNTGGRGFGVTVSGSAQGYSKPTGGVDASLRYEFLKNKAASLTLSVSDIFRSRINDVYTYANYFTQDAFRRRDPQFFRLQFNYRFGKFDASLFKRKNLKGEMDSMQGSMQGVQQ